MKITFLLLSAVFVAIGGCDTSVMYERAAPQTPVRWPDDVEMCSTDITAVIKLNIVVTLAKFTSVPGFAAGGGCTGFVGDKHFISILDDDGWGTSAAMKVDDGGHYRTYQVRYDFLLAKDKYFTSGMYYDPNWRDIIPATAFDPPVWRYNQPIDENEIVVINGLKWMHYSFYGFDSASSDPRASGIPASLAFPFYKQQPQPTVSVEHPQALLWVGEVYEHRIDDQHKMRVWAQYSRTVTQDAHWLKVRRAMLRKLVGTVTITPLTPERLKKLKDEREVANRMEQGG